MPLLSEFASYLDWEAAAEIWAKMLYNRPVSQRVDYSISNLADNESSLTDKNAGGFLKHRAKSKVAENANRF